MKHIEGFIASDHRGVKLKQEIKEHFSLIDVGPFSDKIKVDYPDYAKKVCKDVLKFKSKGILICGSGLGMSIAANKIKGIRAALCNDEKMAEMSRLHNAANVLCLGSDFVKSKKAIKIVKKFLTTDFSHDERHKKRIRKLE